MIRFMIPRSAPNEDDHVVLSVGGRDYKIRKGVEYVVREKGKWVFKHNPITDPKGYFIRIVCHKCNLHTGQVSNFCPNCGADMRKGDNDG